VDGTRVVSRETYSSLLKLFYVSLELSNVCHFRKNLPDIVEGSFVKG
jgi:hypothetical protein